MSFNVGPFAFSGSALALFAAIVLAALAGRKVAHDVRSEFGNVLLYAIVAGIVAARLAFVALWYRSYLAAPWTALDIRDGGFLASAGVIVAFAVAWWHGWRRPRLRKPIAVGVAIGALVWGFLSATMLLLERPSVPPLAFTTLEGQPVKLEAVAGGRPFVVNLWATWCPPCRREMPVLAVAQREQKNVAFIFVNQGEDAARIKRFFVDTGLDLDNVLLDTSGDLAREVGTVGLPTTLFYDAQGRLVDTHLGPLSRASLLSKLYRLR